MLKYQFSRKSVQWELSWSMQMDGQTDMTEQIVAFRYFAKGPNNAVYFPQDLLHISLSDRQYSPRRSCLIILHIGYVI
jgi:hypothetical protein